MSIRVMSDVWEYSQQSGSALLMLLAIADFADDDGIAFPNTATLAKKIRMSEPSVKRIRKELYDSGELEYLKGGNHRGDPLYVRVTVKGINMTPINEGRVLPVIPISEGRVSNGAGKGITQRALRVSPVIPDPSLEPPLEPPIKEESARDWQPTLDAAPAPTPTPSEKTKSRGRVTSKNIDPRKIGPDGLIPEGKGETPLEAWREYSAYTPTAAQIREMMKIEDLGEWRAHVQECVVRRGFKGCGNVLETWANGFRQPANGYNGNGKQSGRIFDAAPTASVSGVVRPPECPERIWTQLRDSQQRAMAEAEPAQRRIFVERTEQRIRERNESGV